MQEVEGNRGGRGLRALKDVMKDLDGSCEFRNPHHIPTWRLVWPVTHGMERTNDRLEAGHRAERDSQEIAVPHWSPAYAQMCAHFRRPL